METLTSASIGLYVNGKSYFLQVICDKEDLEGGERNDYLIPITAGAALKISHKEDLKIIRVTLI